MSDWEPRPASGLGYPVEPRHRVSSIAEGSHIGCIHEAERSGINVVYDRHIV